MEKHEKIWVMDLKESPHPVQAEINGPVIVLSAEELQDVFHAGGHHWISTGAHKQASDFETYLKNKGISL